MDNRKTVLEVNDLVVSFSMYKKGFRKENLEVIHSLSIDVKEKQRKMFQKYQLDKSVEEMYPFQLSGGMARRVLISAAVLELLN